MNRSGSPESLPLYLRLLIVLQALTAYMTETTFLPVEHNVGAFELSALCLMMAALAHYSVNRRRLQWHWVYLPYFVLLIVAGISFTKLLGAAPERVTFAFMSILVLVFTLSISLVLFNLLQTSQRTTDLFLQAVAAAAGIISLWVIADSVLHDGSIGASGPFRNRAHVGIYMHATFWLVLVRINWPRISKQEKFCLYFVLALLLYVVATSGRRSVYFALGVGLCALAVGGGLSTWKVRRRITRLVLVSACSLAFTYIVLADHWGPAAFFRDRVGMIQTRLEDFTATSAEATTDTDFMVLQRQGGIRAIQDNPILGIGYGGFPESEYSPTGHEMHSTPLRFVAELGLIGVTIYIWFTSAGLWLVFGSWRRARGTAFEGAALVLLVGMLASTVSYAYNRQMTDRTFWLSLAVAAAMDVLIRRGSSHSKRPLRGSGHAQIKQASAAFRTNQVVHRRGVSHRIRRPARRS